MTRPGSTRCSRRAGSPSSAPPATRPSSGRRWPARCAASPAAAAALNAGDARDEAMYPSRGRRRRGTARSTSPCSACPPPRARRSWPRPRRAGARAAVVCAGGFAEAGGRGIGSRPSSPPSPRSTGIRVLGPNTVRLPRSARRRHGQLRARRARRCGRAGSPSSRPAAGSTTPWRSCSPRPATGSASAVGLGNAVDVTAADVLDHLADDPTPAPSRCTSSPSPTGPRLVAAVRRLAAERPVVALVVGRHDVGAFAASHTGALATSWRTTRAALAQAGAVVVDDERELVDAVGALSVTRARPAGRPGVGVVTAQAGPGLLLLDDLRGRRARVPELAAPTRRHAGDAAAAADLPGQPGRHRPAGPGVRRRSSHAVAADPEIDLVAGVRARTSRTPSTWSPPSRSGRVADGAGRPRPRRQRCRRRASRAATCSRPAIAGRRPTPPAWPRRPGPCSPTPASGHRSRGAGDRRPRCRPGSHGPHDEDQAKTLLDGLGIATTPRRACGDPGRGPRRARRARRAGRGEDARRRGAAQDRDRRRPPRHPDRGRARRRARRARRDRRRALPRRGHGARRRRPGRRRPPRPGVRAGRPARPRRHHRRGARRRRDPAGAAGPGRGRRRCPTSSPGAPCSTAGAAAPCSTAPSSAEVVAALGDLLVANPDLAEIEINPLRLTADGLVALDAVVIPAHGRSRDGGR